MKTAIIWFGALVGTLAISACPIGPVSPDGGAGAPGIDAMPPAACQNPGSRCCRICTTLATHACPESLPTAKGATCEARCAYDEGLGDVLRTPDVSACTTVACIRSAGRGIECAGGQ